MPLPRASGQARLSVLPAQFSKSRRSPPTDRKKHRRGYYRISLSYATSPPRRPLPIVASTRPTLSRSSPRRRRDPSPQRHVTRVTPTTCPSHIYQTATLDRTGANPNSSPSLDNFCAFAVGAESGPAAACWNGREDYVCSHCPGETIDT